MHSILLNYKQDPRNINKWYVVSVKSNNIPLMWQKRTFANELESCAVAAVTTFKMETTQTLNFVTATRKQ